MPAPAPRQGGFTLLEILIALAIAAIALGVLFGGAAEGLRASRAALGYEEAIARARSHLAASRVNPAPGDEQGDDGSGFRWRVLIRPMDRFRPRPEGRPTAAPMVPNQPGANQPGANQPGANQPGANGPGANGPGASQPGMDVALYAITVWITWRDGGQVRELRLDSETLLPEAPAGASARPGRG